MNGIKAFIEELKKINGADVLIHIGNKLYGDQNIKCAFHIVNDEERLGFSINEQEIFIYKNEICNFELNDGVYYFADKVMYIKIRKVQRAV